MERRRHMAGDVPRFIEQVLRAGVPRAADAVAAHEPDEVARVQLRTDTVATVVAAVVVHVVHLHVRVRTGPAVGVVRQTAGDGANAGAPPTDPLPHADAGVEVGVGDGADPAAVDVNANVDKAGAPAAHAGRADLVDPRADGVPAVLRRDVGHDLATGRRGDVRRPVTLVIVVREPVVRGRVAGPGARDRRAGPDLRVDDRRSRRRAGHPQDKGQHGPQHQAEALRDRSDLHVTPCSMVARTRLLANFQNHITLVNRYKTIFYVAVIAARGTIKA